MATKLTDRIIRELEPGLTERTVREGAGFGVRIRPTGRKSFTFIYDFAGKRRRLDLGEYPETTLPQARTRHAEARALLGKGIDPADHRQAETAIQQAEQQRELDRIAAEQAQREAEARRVTVAEWADRYIEQYAKPRKKSWPEDDRLLRREVLPVLGDRKLDTIKRADIIALMEGIKARLRREAETGINEATGRKARSGMTGTTANRVHAVLSKMLGYALESELIEHNPAQGIKSAKVREVSRERTLTDSELAWVWQTLSGDLAGLGFGRDVADALLLMLATGQRKAEILSLRFDMIHDGTASWTSAQMKSSKRHSIPLPPLARDIIERRRAISLDPSGFVFPSARNPDAPMRPESPNHGVYDLFNGRHDGTAPPMAAWTPHDLRRTVATNLARMGISRTVIDRIQAHADGSIAGVYDRHDYMTETSDALRRWNDRILELAGREA